MGATQRFDSESLADLHQQVFFSTFNTNLSFNVNLFREPIAPFVKMQHGELWRKNHTDERDDWFAKYSISDNIVKVFK